MEQRSSPGAAGSQHLEETATHLRVLRWNENSSAFIFFFSHHLFLSISVELFYLLGIFFFQVFFFFFQVFLTIILSSLPRFCHLDGSSLTRRCRRPSHRSRAHQRRARDVAATYAVLDLLDTFSSVSSSPGRHVSGSR